MRLHPFNSGLGSVSFFGTSFGHVNDGRLRCAPPGAFDYEFGALDDLDNPLTKSYTGLVYLTFGTMTRGRMLFMNLYRRLPGWLVRSTFQTASGGALQKAKENRDQVYHVGRELIEQKRQEVAVGQPEKDVLSLLGVSHQVSPPPSQRLTSGRSLRSQSKRRPGHPFEVTRR